MRSPASVATNRPDGSSGSKEDTGKGEDGSNGRSDHEPAVPSKHLLTTVPGPNAPIPRKPGSAAAALEQTHLQLDDLVSRWVGRGSKLSDPLADSIELLALYQQRTYRAVAAEPRLSVATIARVPGDVVGAVRANIAAQRGLYSLTVPTKPPVKLRTATPAPPNELLAHFKLAERRFGVPWEVLAAVNLVETRFGRLTGPSSAGALGPMQFLPDTWDRYGAGGDVFDPHDAILGAARYLSASGAPADMRGALFTYNNSDAYVNAVLDYALRMEKDRRDFYAYYFWQVFARTTKGDLQLTGPGTTR